MGVAKPVRVLDAVEESERVMRGRVLDVRAYGGALALEPARVYSGAFYLNHFLLIETDPHFHRAHATASTTKGS